MFCHRYAIMNNSSLRLLKSSTADNHLLIPYQVINFTKIIINNITNTIEFVGYFTTGTCIINFQKCAF